MVTGRPSMARKMPMKSSRWKGRSLATAARRAAESEAMIISRTSGRRSLWKNMCSVRTRPIPSAPNSRALCASSGVSAFARTPIVRAASAQARNSWTSGNSAGGRSCTASRITSPVSPSTAMMSSSRTIRPPALKVRCSSSTTMSPAPTTQGLPMPTATTAACEVRPPREVTMPSAAYMPATSSGDVSARTRITGLPSLASSTARSGSNTACPTAPPGEAGRPRARRRPLATARSRSSGSSAGRKSLRSSHGGTRSSEVSRSMTCSRTRSTATRTAARGRPLARARLQEIELALLDGELDVLHVLVMALEAAGDGQQLVVDRGHPALEVVDVLRGADARHHVLALGVGQELGVEVPLAGARDRG